MPKILILGYGRSGKDTMADYLQKEYGYISMSSSLFANKFVFNAIKDICEYSSEEECYKDRHSKRKLWYELICAYNEKNKSRLAESLLEHSDVYVGMRSIDEFVACRDKNIFDVVVWVSADNRVGITEDHSSCTVHRDLADVVIENNGSMEDFYCSIDLFVNSYLKGL